MLNPSPSLVIVAVQLKHSDLVIFDHERSIPATIEGRVGAGQVNAQAVPVDQDPVLGETLALQEGTVFRLVTVCLYKMSKGRKFVVG